MGEFAAALSTLANPRSHVAETGEATMAFPASAFEPPPGAIVPAAGRPADGGYPPPPQPMIAQAMSPQQPPQQAMPQQPQGQPAQQYPQPSPALPAMQATQVAGESSAGWEGQRGDDCHRRRCRRLARRRGGGLRVHAKARRLFRSDLHRSFGGSGDSDHRTYAFRRTDRGRIRRAGSGCSVRRSGPGVPRPST